MLEFDVFNLLGTVLEKIKINVSCYEVSVPLMSHLCHIICDSNEVLVLFFVTFFLFLYRLHSSVENVFDLDATVEHVPEIDSRYRKKKFIFSVEYFLSYVSI